MPMSDTCLSHANSGSKHYWRPAAKKRLYFRQRARSEAEFTEKPEASVPGEAARTKHDRAASGAGRVAVETEGEAPAQGAKPWASGLPLNFFQASAEESAPSVMRGRQRLWFISNLVTNIHINR